MRGIVSVILLLYAFTFTCLDFIIQFPMKMIIVICTNVKFLYPKRVSVVCQPWAFVNVVRVQKYCFFGTSFYHPHNFTVDFLYFRLQHRSVFITFCTNFNYIIGSIASKIYNAWSSEQCWGLRLLQYEIIPLPLFLYFYAVAPSFAINYLSFLFDVDSSQRFF